MGRYIALLGAPGSGKGVRANYIKDHLGIFHLSSGDLLREYVRLGSTLGNLAKGFMDRGELVPDEAVIRMILERIEEPDCQNGVVFDGFPRTISQAEALNEGLAARGLMVETAILIEVSQELLLRRLAGRRFCTKCGAVYNSFFNPAKIPGVCNVDGAPLEQRKDDRPEVILRRIKEYEQSSAPVVDFYRNLGVLRVIPADAGGDVDANWKILNGVLDEQ